MRRVTRARIGQVGWLSDASLYTYTANGSELDLYAGPDQASMACLYAEMSSLAARRWAVGRRPSWVAEGYNIAQAWPKRKRGAIDLHLLQARREGQQGVRSPDKAQDVKDRDYIILAVLTGHAPQGVRGNKPIRSLLIPQA